MNTDELVADNPDISSKEAFKMAKEMMDGNKWSLFSLSFSFVGWVLLTVLTCGIGSIFLTPYMEAAYADLYAG